MKESYVSGSLVNGLFCSKCNKTYDFSVNQTYATCCERPLVFSYQLENETSKSILHTDKNSIWKYAPFLPILNPHNIVSLGEGLTPIHKMGKQFRMSQANKAKYKANLDRLN